MLSTSPPTRRGRCAGPDWLVAAPRRGGRAPRRRRRGRPPPRRSGATAASASSTSSQFRPFAADAAGRARRRAGARRRPVGGRGRRARRAWSSCATAASCTTSSTPPRGQGRAGVRHRHVRRRRDRRAARHLLRRVARRVHRAARRVPRRRRVRARCPRGVVVEQADRRAALVRGRRPRVVPAHARGRRGRRRRSRCSTATAPPTQADGVGHLVDAVVELLVGDNAHVRYLSVQEHGPHTWQIALQRAHLGRDASLQSSAVALGGDYARLRSESLLAGSGRARATSARGVLRRRSPDARLPHAAGPRRAQHAQRPAVQGRGRGHRAVGVLGPHPHPRPTAQKVEAFQTNRNLVLTEGADAPSRSRTSRSRPTT